MSNFDYVEKLRERANVSYEDAKSALDACGGDLLEALIYLEKRGKVSAPGAGSYTSKPPEQPYNDIKQLPPAQPKGETFTDMINRFFAWCGELIRKGCANYMEVWRKGNKILSIPVIILMALMIFAFWITLPIMVVGLFFNFRYTFCGENVEGIDVNKVMDSAANAAEGIKTEVKNAQNNNPHKRD